MFKSRIGIMDQPHGLFSFSSSSSSSEVQQKIEDEEEEENEDEPEVHGEITRVDKLWDSAS